MNVTNELLDSYKNPETQEYEYGKFAAQYKNWTYYSSGVSGVTVPATLSTSTGLEYINYVDGFVSFSGTIPATPPTCTYSYNVVSVIDGFPELENFDQYQLPLIAVDFNQMSRKPMGIGGGFLVTRSYDLEIFANSDSERDQMIQVLHDSLQYNFAILNFEVTGYPLLFNGSINSAYLKSPASTSGVRATARVLTWNSRVIRIPNAEERFKHRAIVTVGVEVEG